MFHFWNFILCLCLWCFYESSAVIYHLNDSEYQRMPPLYSLEDYESCMVEEGGTYCLMKLTLYAEPGNELMRMIHEYSDYTYKHHNYSIIDRGVCVQKSCQKYVTTETNVDLTRSLEECLNDSLKIEYDLYAKITTLFYCDHHKEKWHIDTWDWTVCAIIVGLVIINVVASAYDCFLSKQQKKNLDNGNSFLLSFSLKRSWRILTISESKYSEMKDIQYLHGVRVISNLCVLLLHAVMTFAIGFSKNPHDIEKAFDYRLYMLIYNGMHIVQIFFFMSGFLTTYFLQMEEQKRSLNIWDIPKIILLRVFRFSPILALALALSGTWFRHLSSGPLWKLFVSGSLAAKCRTHWWRHLFFLNNYYGEGICLLPTWQLAAEMQVFLVCVTAYVATKGRIRNIVLGVLLVLGALAPALHIVLQDLDVIIVSPQYTRDLREGTFWLQHTPGHNNTTCFIIGMATAVFLFNWRKNGGKLVVNKWYNLTQYLSLAAFLLIMYCGHFFYTEGPRPSLVARVGYTIGVRLLIGLACVTGITSLFVSSTGSSYLKSMFEWRRWVVPSRLSYCVFVMHMMLVHYIMGVRTELGYFSTANVFINFVFIAIASYTFAVPCFLIVEAPFTSLFKSIMKKQATSKDVSKNEISNGKHTSDRNGKTAIINGISNGNGAPKKKTM